MRDFDPSDGPRGFSRELPIETAVAAPAVFVERLFLGLCIGAGAVSVLHLRSLWAASLAFTAFVVYLVLQWARLARSPGGVWYKTTKR